MRKDEDTKAVCTLDELPICCSKQKHEKINSVEGSKAYKSPVSLAISGYMG